jgi:Pyruvate/2-oxoacid:ferredoxin oxidoreductase delta subunit
VSHAELYYFSGTGNTTRAAELIAAELRAVGRAATLHRVGRDATRQAHQVTGGEGDVLRVFLVPIYACGIPALFTRFLRSLPRADGVRAAVVCTMGDAISYDKEGRRHHVPGFAGHALLEAARILRRRGYDVLQIGACSYPLNWTQAVEAPELQIAAEVREIGDGHATEIGMRIAAGERCIRPFSKAHTLWTIPFDRLFRVFGRVALGKLYVADSDCTACGRCVSECPARAIRLHGKQPRWGWSCQASQHCFNTCPRNAIQTSWLRVIAEAIHSLIPIPFLVWRLGPHPYVPVRPVLLEVLFWLAVFAAFTWLLDEVIWLLGLIPGVKRLVEWNFTKRFRRYLEPHFSATTQR